MRKRKREVRMREKNLGKSESHEWCTWHSHSVAHVHRRISHAYVLYDCHVKKFYFW